MNDKVMVETCRNPSTGDVVDRWFPCNVPAESEIMKVLTGEITDEAKVGHITSRYRLIVVEEPDPPSQVELSESSLSAENLPDPINVPSISVDGTIAFCGCGQQVSGDQNFEVRIWAVTHFAEHMKVNLT